MSGFEWNSKRSEAAIMLSQGHLTNEVADAIGVSDRTIRRWKADIEFSSEVDRLSLMTDIASRAERLRIAKRIVRDLSSKNRPTQKDLLEWLKYAQSETDGAKIDFAPILEAYASMAGGGQVGDDAGAADSEPDDD
jgi:uncharacterized protein YjcR